MADWRLVSPRVRFDGGALRCRWEPPVSIFEAQEQLRTLAWAHWVKALRRYGGRLVPIEEAQGTECPLEEDA